MQSAARFVVAVCALCFLEALLLRQLGFGTPTVRSDVFVYLFVTQEWPFLVLTGVFAAGAAVYITRQDDHNVPNAAAVMSFSHRRDRLLLAMVAGAVLALAWMGSRLVFHGTLIAADEYALDFQARIFAAGRLAAPVSAEWQPLVDALRPLYITYDRGTHSWLAAYLPVYSAIRAAFTVAAAPGLTNPALAAACVPGIWGVARRLWPERAWDGWMAVGLLVTSSQFLLTAMSGFPLVAHLLLNLVWLYLYVRGGRVAWALVPWVGAAALGLHQPFPHLLFVLPFLVRLLRQRRFGWLGYFGVVYSVAAAAWYNYLLTARPRYAGVSTMLFHPPSPVTLLLQVAAVAVTLSWQTPLLVLLAVVAGRMWNDLPATSRDLLAGVLLTFAFYTLFDATQGHGWGYRYVFPVLGNLVLLGVEGARTVARSAGRASVARLAFASALVTLAAQLPTRLALVERFVAPFARAREFIVASRSPVVIVDPDSVWLGQDLVRNDPALSPPRVLSGALLSPQTRDSLRSQSDDSVTVISRADLARLGVIIRLSSAKERGRSGAD